MYDFLIVGCGFAGSVLAERIASQLDKKVLIVEKRNHIAGNMYDYYNEDGILVQKYGPHIFQTDDKKIYDYLSQFTQWRIYQHKSMSSVEGHLYPFPINMNTLEKYYGIKFSSPEQVQEYFDHVRVPVQVPKNSEEVITSQIGKELYTKFFKNYIIKQWDTDPKDIDGTVTSRILIRNNRDNRTFFSRYQAMPLYGFTKMFERMLNHKNIRIMLQTDYRDIINDIKYDKMIYTGPIDEYFNFKYGKLSYRSVNFEQCTYDCEVYQPAATINYPNEYDFTRITEFKYLTGQKHKKTTVVKEFPVSCQDSNEKYYPLLTEKSIGLYKEYKEESAKLKDVYFCGRLANYEYIDMDLVIAKAFKLFEKQILPNKNE